MKKGVLQSSIVVGIIVLFVGAGVLPSTIGTTKEKTIIIKIGSRGYIQGLIDNASNGDTIYIPSGIYYENIIINKSISLVGEDRNNTIIDGGGSGYDVVSVFTDSVNISGFTIKKAGGWWSPRSGIAIQSCYNTICNNIITENYMDGIRVSCNNNIILNNNITNNGNSIVLDSENNTISNNIITEDNFYLDSFSCNNIISHNSFFNSGLVVSSICYNSVTNNTVNSKPLFYLYDKSDLVFDGDPGQIILIGCTNITIRNEEIFNTANGIQLLESNDCVISDNTITNNYLSGLIIDGENNTILSNTIINNRYRGISLGGDSNTLTKNTISYNGGDGITLDYYSIGNDITGNNINSNNWNGISLFGANNNTITSNIITNNKERSINLINSCMYNTISDNTITGNAMYLRYSHSNIIINNTITYCGYCGIWISDNSSTNTVSSNIITNNDYGISFYSYLGFNNNNNTISDNTIINQSYYGIDLYSGDNNTISGNTIKNNRNGIRLTYRSDYNNIINNTIANNDNVGIYLYYLHYYHNNHTIIYHNNFINNGKNANDSGSEGNIWYHAGLQEGNYWSDYTGDDLNGDGIGDIPYDIPGGKTHDLYPFMEPNGWLKEPDFQKAFIFGKITNLSSLGGYVTFEAVKTRVIIFRPFSFHKYISGEECFVLKVYRGLIDVRYVFALCRIEIRV